MGNNKNKTRHYNNHRHVYARRKPAQKYKKKQKTVTTNTLTTSSGSRIINIDNLGEYINVITKHSASCGGTVTLTGEKRDGLASVLASNCNKCNHKISFATSKKVKGPRGINRWESNLAAVWGQMVTGGGHTSLSNTMSVLGVPVMAKGSFTPTESDIGEWWRQKLNESMIEAGKQEKKFEEEKKEFHEGVPAITVIVDGGWSKRSHKHSYNAKSGVGIIIGQRTGKLLHIGVRNKYCAACTQGISQDNHHCYKNWEESSSQMERDIIVEGFVKAEATHGIRYTTFIGDGDSSVYPTLLNEVPIWGCAIKKIECANHACKCYRSRLEKLASENSDYRKGGLGPKMRKRLTSAARCAIKMRSQGSNRPQEKKILERDLMNGPLHCFGYHEHCSADFCRTVQEKQSTQTNVSPAEADILEDDDITEPLSSVSQEQHDLWKDTTDDSISVEEDATTGGTQQIEVSDQMLLEIKRIVSRLASKAPQLIDNFTTNLAEGWMNIRCKFDGGKTINRSQAGSWEFRCMGAGLQLNLGHQWGPQAFSEMTKSAINPVYQSVAEKAAKKVANDKKRKATTEAKEKRRKSKYSKKDNSVDALRAYSRQNGGIEPEEVIEDVSPDTLEELKTSFYNTKVKVTKEEAKDIAQDTVTQGQSELWSKERKKRLTASAMGGILKMKATTKRSKKVENLLYSKFRGNRATLYGIEMEPIARSDYVQYQQDHGHSGLKTEHVGLVVSVDNPWMAASPDDRVYDPSVISPWGLTEYKNPYSARNMSLSQACKSLKTFCLQEKEKEHGEIVYSLKKRHDYFFQIQCQLYCDNREWCDFVLRTEKELHIERITRNRDWWKDQIPKLHSFYFDALLPELACPRHGKGGIREPQPNSN